MAIRFNSKKFNVRRLVRKLAWTLMSLFVGGLFLTYFVSAMNGSCSPFYKTLTIVGVQVCTNGTAPYANCYCRDTLTGDPNTITSPSMSAGILSVVGILSIGSVLMSEFITW